MTEKTLPKIGCLAWGSLEWDPRTLKVNLPWQHDGPTLSAPNGASMKRFSACISPGRIPDASRVRSHRFLWNGPLSKDAGSRLVGHLHEAFDTWRSRDLADEGHPHVFLDGWFPKVPIGGHRARVPVLVTLDVRAGGHAGEHAGTGVVCCCSSACSAAARSSCRPWAAIRTWR